MSLHTISLPPQGAKQIDTRVKTIVEYAHVQSQLPQSQ